MATTSTISAVGLGLALALLLSTAPHTASAGTMRPTTGFDDLFWGFPDLTGYGGPYSQHRQQRVEQRQPAQDITASRGPEHRVTENKDETLITIDVAGFKESDISVSIESNVLKITGTHKCEHPGICIDRTFTRGFDLRGANVDLSQISAKRSLDSVMSICLPKIGTVKRLIPVQLEVHIEPAAPGVTDTIDVVNAEVDTQPEKAVGGTDSGNADSETGADSGRYRTTTD